MSASAIQDALVTTLSAASVFGSGNVSTNFRVLESSSACACVVGWMGVENVPDTYGMGGENHSKTLWTFSTRIYLKDVGSAVELMDDHVPAVIDKLVSAMRDDDTVQGTAEQVVAIRADRDPDIAFTVGGATWLMIDGEVDIEEWL